MLCLIFAYIIFHAKINQKTIFIMNGLLYFVRNMDHFADISCIIIILVMRYFSCYSKKINMSDHAKGKFLWHIQWLTATAFLATKSLQWFQMLKSPFQIDAIFFWQFCAKKNRRHSYSSQFRNNLILFYFWPLACRKNKS